MRPHQQDTPDEQPPEPPQGQPPNPRERPPPRGDDRMPPGQGEPPGTPGGRPAGGGHRTGPPPQQEQPAQQSAPRNRPAPQDTRPGPAGGQPAGGGHQPGPPPQGNQPTTQPRQPADPGGPQQRRRAVLEPISVGDVARTDVVTADPDTPIETVVSRMAQEGVGSVVVVEDDAPVGILTDREIALSLSEIPDLAEEPADSLVGDDVLTGSTDMSVLEALNRMSGAGVRRLPLVDDEGRLQGIVTIDDVLVMLGEEFADVTRVVQRQSPRP